MCFSPLQQQSTAQYTWRIDLSQTEKFWRGEVHSFSTKWICENNVHCSFRDENFVEDFFCDESWKLERFRPRLKGDHPFGVISMSLLLLLSMWKAWPLPPRQFSPNHDTMLVWVWGFEFSQLTSLPRPLRWASVFFLLFQAGLRVYQQSSCHVMHRKCFF